MELTGFRPNTVKSVRLLANRSERVDVVLEPGTITQTVEVNAGAPVLTTETATIGNVLEGRPSRNCRSTAGRWIV